MHSNNPLLSILIHSHNGAKTLSQVLENIKLSVSFEIIICDDGSTDKETIALLKKLAKTYQVIYLPHARGKHAALNRAGDLARGKYLIALSQDEIIFPKSIESLLASMELENLDLAWGDVLCTGMREYKRAMIPVLDAWYLSYLNGLPGCAIMRKRAWNRAGGWKKDGYENWNLWQRFASSGAKGKKFDLIMAKCQSKAFETTGYHHKAKAAREPQRGSWKSSKAPLRLKLIFPLWFRLPTDTEKKSKRAKSLASLIWMKDKDAARGRLLELKNPIGPDDLPQGIKRSAGTSSTPL